MNRAVTRILALASIIALMAASIPSMTNAQPTSDTNFVVSASWLAGRSNDPSIAVVDTRPAEAYGQGHIPGAVNLPWQLLAQPNTDELQIAPWEERMLNQLGGLGINSSDRVVSYDDGGNLFAARMRWVLKYFGHENAAVLDGGLPAWTELEQPLARQATTRPATTYTGTPNRELLATWEYVLGNLGSPDVQILDVRPQGVYTGETAGTDLHAGHIPGAVNLDWNNIVEAQPPRTFKTMDELQAAFGAIGLDRNKEIIVYCVSGVASANTLLTLEMLGYPRVRLYSASWVEWGNREDLPFSTGPEPGGDVAASILGASAQGITAEINSYYFPLK